MTRPFICKILIWGLLLGLPDSIGAKEFCPPPPSPAVTAKELGIDIERENNARRRKSSPNVIVILADDLGYGDASTYGGDIPTPNLDRLARGGARFTDGYSASSVCSPARAALLTGKQPMAIPHNWNVYNQHKHGLSLKEKTLADHFSRLGYSTGMMGKWHLGLGEGYAPGDRGFDEFLLLSAKRIDKSAVFERYRFSIPESCKQKKPFYTDITARAASHFILRHRKVPFFLYIPTRATHAPWSSRRESYSKQSSWHLNPAYVKRNEQERKYFKSLVYLDQLVGHVLDTIDFLGLSENTLIWFLSDNGKFLKTGSSLLRGGKGRLYENGIRVPFIVRWTGTIVPGVYQQPVQSLDILPTSLAAAGAANPLSENESRYVIGRNILPWLENPSDPPDRYLYWKQRHIDYGNQSVTHATRSVVRFGDWKLLSTKLDGTFVKRELYNLRDDVEERNDLLASPCPFDSIAVRKECQIGRDMSARYNGQLQRVSDVFLDLSRRLDVATEFIPD